jgi:hypothetical protein
MNSSGWRKLAENPVIILTGLAASLIGIFVFLTGTPDLPTIFSTPGEASTPGSSWVVAYEHEFPSDFWTPGTHDYTLTISCPLTEPTRDTVSHSFEVSEEAASIPGAVYLRVTGLRDAPFEEGELLETIHPNQPTIARVSLTYPTVEEAQVASQDCQLFISWDGRSPQSLLSAAPYLYQP